MAYTRVCMKCTCSFISIPFWHICWLECQCTCTSTWTCAYVFDGMSACPFIHIHTYIFDSFACLTEIVILYGWLNNLYSQLCTSFTTFGRMNDWLEIEKYLNRLVIPQTPTLCEIVVENCVIIKLNSSVAHLCARGSCPKKVTNDSPPIFGR